MCVCLCVCVCVCVRVCALYMNPSVIITIRYYEYVINIIIRVENKSAMIMNLLYNSIYIYILYILYILCILCILIYYTSA